MPSRNGPRVLAVRALVPVADAGADYHRQPAGHWITDTKIANPMSGWPEYRASRTSWGIGALGTFVVEVEASDGTPSSPDPNGSSTPCVPTPCPHRARYTVKVTDVWDSAGSSACPGVAAGPPSRSACTARRSRSQMALPIRSRSVDA